MCMKKTKFTPITRKVNSIILISLIIGIGLITLAFSTYFLVTFENATEENLNQQAEQLYVAIENMMLPGEADIAINTFQQLSETASEHDIKLLRTSGEPAFSDASTRREVRENIPEEKRNNFPLDISYKIPDVIVEKQYFKQAVQLPAPSVSFRERRENGNLFFRLYMPLINKPKCTRCHGSDHTIRGVIDLQNNITNLENRQQLAIITASSLFLAVVLLISFILTRFLKRSVITPVKDIGEVCREVTDGNFETKVNAITNDEIGNLGSTVNTMVDGLFERFQLSKFVSSSTLKSLHAEDQEGKEVQLTLLFSDIRGFTSYTESHPPAEVVKYLNNTLNTQTNIIQNNGGDIDKYVGDEIIAVWAGEDAELKAARTAFQIQREISTGSEDTYGGLQVGIGINCGKVILGMIGSEKRADFTVIGDNVNTAARMCSAAKPNQIIIADHVYQVIKQISTVKGPYRMKAKGKESYVRVYSLEEMTEGSE